MRFTTLQQVKDRIEALEAELENSEAMDQMLVKELEEEKEMLDGVIESVEANSIDEAEFDAVAVDLHGNLEYIADGIRNGIAYYESVEAYAREVYSDEIPDHIANYIDYESMGEDLLADVSYCEMRYGGLLIYGM